MGFSSKILWRFEQSYHNRRHCQLLFQRITIAVKDYIWRYGSCILHYSCYNIK